MACGRTSTVSERKSPKRAEWGGEPDIVQPPQTLSVEATPKILLYRADGTPLKRPIGFTK